MLFDVRTGPFFSICPMNADTRSDQWRALLVTNNLNFSIRDYAFAEWYKELGNLRYLLLLVNTAVA